MLRNWKPLSIFPKFLLWFCHRDISPPTLARNGSGEMSREELNELIERCEEVLASTRELISAEVNATPQTPTKGE